VGAETVLFCEFYDLLPCFQCSQASKPLRSIPWPAANWPA